MPTPARPTPTPPGGVPPTPAHPPAHVYPRSTTINERGHLSFDGCDALELAGQFGTPVYVVVEADLRARAREFRDALAQRHPDSAVIFASKAFPCTAVLRALAEEDLCCDVASGGELALALRAGFDPARVYLHGNANSRRELGEAVAAGVGHIVLDSFDEIERLDAVLAEQDAPAQQVLIRVTPDVSGDTHHAISTGQADSKFGFSMAEAPEALARAEASPRLELAGLHCHIGSQLLDLAPLHAAAEALATLGRYPVVNLGGGLGVPYTRTQRAPEPVEYVEAVVAAAHAAFGTGVRLLIEPGRALVADSTVTLYTVQSVKRNVSTWVAVDGGMSDNLRPMLYGAPYEVACADRPLAPATEPCRIAGKHCESGDVIVRDAQLPAPAVDDVLVTPVTGAYGYAMANNYNGVPRPPVVFCRDGRARLVVRRETYDDLTRRDVEEPTRG